MSWISRGRDLTQGGVNKSTTKSEARSGAMTAWILGPLHPRKTGPQGAIPETESDGDSNRSVELTADASHPPSRGGNRRTKDGEPQRISRKSPGKSEREVRRSRPSRSKLGEENRSSGSSTSKIREKGGRGETFLDVTESQGTETGKLGEDGGDLSVLINEIERHLGRLKKEFPPSAHIEEIETVLQDLFQACESACKDKIPALKAEISMLEKKISMLEAEKDTASHRHEAAILALRDGHDHREKLHRDEMNILQSTRNSIAEEYQRQALGLAYEKEQLASEYQGEVNHLKQQLNAQDAQYGKLLTDELTRMEAEHNKQIFQLQESLRIGTEHHESRKEQMDIRHEEEKQRLLDDFKDEKRGMVNRFNNEIAQALNGYRTMVAELSSAIDDLGIQKFNSEQQITAEFQARISAMENKMQDANNSHRVQLTKMEEMHKKDREKVKTTHEAEKKDLRERHDAKIVALEIKHEQDNKTLKDDIEALKTAMTKRDHFKALSDHEVARRFQELASEVEEFARVQWDHRQEHSWPFPDRLLSKSENERRIKQYVVQNTLWVILYDKIFCTPFRVLGGEGNPLEQDWIQTYSEGRKSAKALSPCPRPSKECEKWRYEAMKKCHDAISQPLMDHEPKFNVKRDYDSSLQDATEDIYQELVKVASVDNDDKQRMSELVRKAAKLWLDVGQQRCRMFLLMSDSGDKPLRSRQAYLDEDRTQKLVVVPELRRRGNAQGERLEKDDLISDCKGIFHLFYAA